MIFKLTCTLYLGFVPPLLEVPLSKVSPLLSWVMLPLATVGGHRAILLVFLLIFSISDLPPVQRILHLLSVMG